MKHCKHYLILLIAGALLLLPVTQYHAYAVSWDDIKRNISSFFNQESLQKIVPGAVAAFGIAAGGLYYYLMRKKSGGGQIEKPKLIEEKKGDDQAIEKPKLILEQPDKTDIDLFMIGASLKQIPVYSENKFGGEGNESSGYHALLRAMQVVKYKGLSREDTFFENGALNENLPDVIEVFFGKKENTGQEENGAWREAIIDQRENQLQESLDGDWLTAKEIISLWNLHKNDFTPENLKTMPYKLYVVENDNFEATKMFIAEEVKPFLNKKEVCSVIFILSMQYFNTVYKHWYSLVMYQNKNGNRRYYIMDSYNNINRIKDTNAWKIINLIEQ
jgi:hypothetical protein